MAISNYLTLSHLRKVLAALDPRFKKIESDISKTATKEYVDEIIDKKVDIEQGTENAGMVLTVNEDGNITASALSLVGLVDTTISLHPSNGQVLVYNSSTSKWVNGTISTGITYSISMSGNIITLTGSDSSTSTVTLPVYNGGVSS